MGPSGAEFDRDELASSVGLHIRRQRTGPFVVLVEYWRGAVRDSPHRPI